MARHSEHGQHDDQPVEEAAGALVVVPRCALDIPRGGNYPYRMESNERNAMKTYQTVGHALADQNSNISRFMDKARETRKRNDDVIAQWMATGLTREQAWAEALKTCR